MDKILTQTHAVDAERCIYKIYGDEVAGVFDRGHGLNRASDVDSYDELLALKPSVEPHSRFPLGSWALCLSTGHIRLAGIPVDHPVVLTER